MHDQFSNTQTIRKPAVTSKGGIVAAQSGKAARGRRRGAGRRRRLRRRRDRDHVCAGRAGALDERARRRRRDGALPGARRPLRGDRLRHARAAELAARGLSADRRRAASDIFPWPRVKDDRNIHGPGAIAVPGVVAGMEEAHRRHAKLPWKELVSPSIALAGEGLAVDWWTTLMISSAAVDLRRYPASAAAYLVDGLPPNAPWGIKSKVRLPQDRLKATMAQLASAGPRDFYEGDLAKSLAADIQAAGGALSVEDLSHSALICASRWRSPIAAARCSRRPNSPRARRCRARSACCRKI